jgi:hypothetical protein
MERRYSTTTFDNSLDNFIVEVQNIGKFIED